MLILNASDVTFGPRVERQQWCAANMERELYGRPIEQVELLPGQEVTEPGDVLSIDTPAGCWDYRLWTDDESTCAVQIAFVEAGEPTEVWIEPDTGGWGTALDAVCAGPMGLD